MSNTVIQIGDGSIVPVNESVSEVVERRDAANRDNTMAKYFVGDTQIAINPAYIILVGDFPDSASYLATISDWSDRAKRNDPEPQPNRGMLGDGFND